MPASCEVSDLKSQRMSKQKALEHAHVQGNCCARTSATCTCQRLRMQLLVSVRACGLTWPLLEGVVGTLCFAALLA